MNNIALSLALLTFPALLMSNNLTEDLEKKYPQAPVEKIINFYPITANIGTAGQPTPNQFALIRAARYTDVINLAAPESANALANEGKLVNAQNMSYTHIPVPWEAPTAQHITAFFNVMDRLKNNKQKILVHCAANYRASVFTYKYLTLREGLSAEDATTPLLKKWLPQMDDNWKAIMALTLDEIE
jgi:protein tyrosine phosphatase (PTP) superfamily phosphohydrolase (DUF442 family)